MVGYDFDKTIYDGDSSTDFFIYMILTRPYLLIFALWFAVVFALYGMKILNKKRTKECLFFFIPWYSNIDKIVDKFWAKHANKIKDWYCVQKQADDVIISASLGFIIKPVMEMLDIKYWAATNFNVKTGKIFGKNCYGDAKVEEFKRLYRKEKLDAYYSDSYSDLPIMMFAKQAFYVEGNKITEINAKEIYKALESGTMKKSDKPY